MAVQSLCNLAVAILTLLIVFLFARPIAVLLGVPRLAAWLYMTPLIVLLTGVGNAATYGLIRAQQFKQLAMFRMAQSVSGAGLQAAAGVAGGGPGGLILGGVMGQVALAGSIVALARRGYGRLIHRALSAQSLMAYARKNRNFPRYMVAYGLAGVLRDRGLLVALSAFASTHEAGLYTFALRLVYAPVGLITTSFSSVIYQRAAGARVPREIAPLIYRIMIKLVTLTVPAFVLLAWFSSGLFSFVFGASWTKAGLYCAIMVPPAFTYLLSGLFDRMLDIVGWQKVAMGIEVGYSILGLVVFTVGLAWLHSVPLALIFFSAVTVFYHIAWIVAVYCAFGFPFRDLFKVAIRTLVLGGAVAGGLWLMTVLGAFSHFAG